eukprot:6265210-Alexandrium_andersonii.AAC.1
MSHAWLRLAPSLWRRAPRVRIKRAARATTQAPAQARDYKPGELVDFDRAGGAKDTSGGEGPARVVDASNILRVSITSRFQCGLPIE